MPLPTPKIDPHGLQDPLSEKFWLDTWVSLAVHNVRGR
jgi:phospholipase D1/2